MVSQGLIRIGMILASLAPSMLCFGLAAYLLVNRIETGWGWLMFIGVISMEVPNRLFRLPEQCPTCQSWSERKQKSEPAYEEVA